MVVLEDMKQAETWTRLSTRTRWRCEGGGGKAEHNRPKFDSVGKQKCCKEQTSSPNTRECRHMNADK